MRKNLLKMTMPGALLAILIVGLTMTSVGTSSPGTVIYVDPPISSAAPGDPLHIDVNIRDVIIVASVSAWLLRMDFDPSILNVLGETNTTNNELANTTVLVKQPPWANFTISPDPPYETAQELTFNASASTPDGGNLTDPDSYFWDFGDESTDMGMVVNHTYVLPGEVQASNYTVTLNVTDTEGLWDIASKNITIYKSVGGSSMSPPTMVLAGETVAGETDIADNVLVDSVVTTSEASTSSFVNIRDVAVTNVVSYPNTVVGGETVYINVTVQNNPLGYRSESFNVSAYAWPIKVGEASGTLEPGESQTYNFAWDTTSTTKARSYTIKAVVSKLRGVEEGPFLKSVGNTEVNVYEVDNELGDLSTDCFLVPLKVGAYGDGTLVTIIFEVKGEGVSPLDIYYTELWTYTGSVPPLLPVPHTTVDGIFTILGDMDGNGSIDSDDLYILAVSYATSVGEPDYTRLADLDRDDDVDSDDLNLFAGKYGIYVGP